MGAGTDEEEVLNVFTLVVGAEPGGLGEDGFEGEAGAAVGIKGGFEIEGGEAALGDEAGLEAGEVVILHVLHDEVAEGLGLFQPIDTAELIGDGDESVEAVVARGGHGGVGFGGAVEIDGKIFAEDFLVEDIVEELFVAAAEKDGVVFDVFVNAAGAEVNDEEAHGVFHAVELLISPLGAGAFRKHFAVGVGDVGVADDGVGGVHLADVGVDAGGDATAGEDAADGGVEMDFAAEFFEELAERGDDGASAAHGVVDAPFAFQMVNQGIDGRRLEGVAADQERVKTEDALEERVFNIALDELENRFVTLETDKGWGDFDHVHEVQEGDVGEFDEAFLEDELGLADHLLVALNIAGGEGGNFAEGF